MGYLPYTRADYKVREPIAVKVLIPHCWIPPWSPSKYSPWEAMHQYQHLVHPSKKFWKWFCGMAFRAAVVLLLMSSMSSKCLPYNVSFIFGNRKKSLGARSGEKAGCSNTAICLVAKNSLTECGVSRCIIVMQDPRVIGKKFWSFPSNFFTQPFQYFQIANLVVCLSSWYKFIMNNPHGGEFANFIVRPRIYVIYFPIVPPLACTVG